MSSELAQLAGSSWDFPFWPTLIAVIATLVYLRGFPSAARAANGRLPRWRAVCFVAGIFVAIAAIASPLDTAGGYLLSAHMTQHFLLLMVAPPLLLLGAPANPMLHGLPAVVRVEWLGPFLASPGLRRCGHLLVHPVFGWLSLVLATWVWHLPALYELALRDPFWHEVEHGFFLTSALLFWFPVIQPWPSKSIWPRWAMVPYLLLADLQNTIFSAFFAFSPRVLYPVYGVLTPAVGEDAMADQALAGAIMWVPGSIAFLLPIAWVWRDMRRRSGPAAQRARWGVGDARAVGLPILGGTRATRTRFNLLALPILGAFFRSARARVALRLLMLALAGVIVIDGFFGPRESPMNLAGVVPWTHWRGIAVLVLLFGGNFVCMACPLTFGRSIAERWRPLRRAFPKQLRNKWCAVGLLVLWLWAYEVLALWNSPAATAWIIVGYFGVAFVIDTLFRGAAFCRYVCPIGQFQQVQSMVSPLEVQATDDAVCTSCTSHACGSSCPTSLFLPRKVGNLDCVFCMQCVDACPHDNVTLGTRRLEREFSFEGPRSAIGAITGRLDLTALLLVLVFGAFANANGMTGPVLDWLDTISAGGGAFLFSLFATGLLLAEVLLLPVTLALMAAWCLSRTCSGEGIRVWASRLALSLVPLGVAMWCVHFVFHFVTGFGSILPVTQRALLDASGGGLANLVGEPYWTAACCIPTPAWLLTAELLLLQLGFVVSFGLGLAMVRRALPLRTTLRVVAAASPLVIVQLALVAWGTWILLQPMQMRGTLIP